MNRGIAVATGAIAAVVATWRLGNAFGANPCAGWTGYVPLGSCVSTFWSAAFIVGPVIGLLVGALAGVLADRATHR